MKTIFFITCLVLNSPSSFSSDLSSMFEVITMTESNNNPEAIGDEGRSWGIAQIQKICVDDVNRIYGTNYTHEEMFDVACAKEVFLLYLQAGISRYYSKHGEIPSEGQVVRMWNGGIYKGHYKRSTLTYLERYKYFKEKINEIQIQKLKCKP